MYVIDKIKEVPKIVWIAIIAASIVLGIAIWRDLSSSRYEPVVINQKTEYYENKKGELVLRGKLSFGGNSDYFLGIMGIVKVRSSVRTMVIDLPSPETMMSLNKSSAPSAPFLPSARMG